MHEIASSMRTSIYIKFHFSCPFLTALPYRKRLLFWYFSLASLTLPLQRNNTGSKYTVVDFQAKMFWLDKDNYRNFILISVCKLHLFVYIFCYNFSCLFVCFPNHFFSKPTHWGKNHFFSPEITKNLMFKKCEFCEK